MKPGDRVMLTEEGRQLFPDIGARPGVVVIVGGKVAVQFAGIDDQIWVAQAILEAA